MLVADAGTPCWLIWAQDLSGDWPEEHCSVRHNPVLSSYFSACSQDFIRWEINIEKTHDKHSSGVQALGPLAVLWNSHAPCPAKIVPVKKGKFYLHSQRQYTGSLEILVTAVCHKPFLWKLLAPQRWSFWLQGNDQVPREHVRDNSWLKSQKRGVSSRKGDEITAAWAPPARETVHTPAAHADLCGAHFYTAVGREGRFVVTAVWGHPLPHHPQCGKISLPNGLKFEIHIVYILRSSFASMGKETSKGNLRKWGNPCF